MVEGEEVLVCVGGPKDGTRVAVLSGEPWVDFMVRHPMPDDGLLYTTWEQADMTLRRVTYEVVRLAVPGRQFRFLVPLGTPPAEALAGLLAGYGRDANWTGTGRHQDAAGT